MANVKTPVFTVSYPNVFKAKKNDLNGKEEYSVVALFAKGADLTALKKAATEAIIEKWGADQKKWPQQMKTPFRKHEDKMKDGVLPAGMEEGGIFMNLKSTQRPAVVDQKVQLIVDESQFYAGCKAIASVRAYAYDQKGNRGVAFGLQNIQKVAEGELLGGRTRPEDDFAPIEGAETSEQPTDATSIF